MGEARRQLLHRRWVHAHEEDSEGEMVFRPADYELPRSRGRMAFELRPDGSFVEAGIGAADVPETGSGTWELQDDEWIMLSGPASGGVPRRMRIASAEQDRLAIER
jgi:hypothetical protein